MADNTRERILEAAYSCVARYGIAKTTVEDVARAAKASRATVYRYFPGGKSQLIADTVAWESARFFQRLADATVQTPDFPDLLEEALIFAHRALEGHEVLQKVLQTEPDTLLPALTVESEWLVVLIQLWLSPAVRRAPLRAGVTVDGAAEYLARMTLSFISAQGRWDLTDRDQVSRLVRTEFLAGLLDL